MGIIGCDAKTGERLKQGMKETRVTVPSDTPSGQPSRPLYEFVKRGIDIVAGVGLLVLFAPCLLAAAIAVRCTSRGPIIFKQVRVGRYGRLFMVWKFRTMTDDADEWAPLITAADDERITPVGKFLRGCKVDELPQLWNVVKGEMSLVGPRPQVQRFVEAFPARDRAIIVTVRPGITGPTQLEFREEEDMLRGQENREEYYIEQLLPVKCRLDVEYVRQRCLLLDMKVLCKTGYAITVSLLRRLAGRSHAKQAEPHIVIIPERLQHRERYTSHEDYREENDKPVIMNSSS